MSEMDERSVLDRLRDELDEVRAENRDLRERVARLEQPSPEPSAERTTRRRALAVAAGAAGGALAATLGTSRAEAADGQQMVLGAGNGADQQTGLEVTGTAVAYGFGVTDNGLSAVPDGYWPSVLGHANDAAFRTAILAYVTGSGATAISAQNDATNVSVDLADGAGRGIDVSVTGSGSTAISVRNDATDALVDLADAAGNGIDVSAALGVGVAASAAFDGVAGTSTGSGAGVHGQSLSGIGPAVWADAANGTGTGLQATSAAGRGIVASGKLAQLQLAPGSQATHPKKGEVGDLFVDKSARLWFCKVGGATATWVKLA